MKKIEEETGIPHETARTILHKRKVRMRHVHATYHPVLKDLNYEAALLLGLHAGDGHLSDSWGISVGGNDRNMLELTISLTKSVLGVEPYIEIRPDNYWIVKSGKKQVREFFERYGFPRGRKAGIVEAPAQVVSSKNPEVWAGFLKGAFSSDGSFWYKKNSGQCRFEVSSRSFRDSFIVLAKRLGFEFHAYSYIHRGGHNKLPLHLAYLGVKEEVGRWMEHVESICDTHLKRYSEWKSKCF